MGFVTAFRGRRDGYEVPVALAERGMLDAFLTDHFHGPVEALAERFLPARHAAKLRSRGDTRIPEALVTRLRATALQEALHKLRGRDDESLYARYDPDYGRAAAAAARRCRSDLLIYSSYAPAAFGARYSHSPRKVLFQFHPHIDLERGLLLADLATPTRQAFAREQELDSGLSPHALRIESDAIWQQADEIVCASSFTRRSLAEAGADPSKIVVVPYGVDLPADPGLAAPDGFHALFVGTGMYRKGLHHLLAAWGKARLPRGAKLTIVARKIEAELLAAVKAAPNVDYLPGVSAAALGQLYRTASLFVMPSIVEGFGQVYLEALAHGLPVLGTANTCIPDLGGPDDGLFVVPAGESDMLAAELERLSVALDGDVAIRANARDVAEHFSWARFREGIGRIAAGA